MRGLTARIAVRSSTGPHPRFTAAARRLGLLEVDFLLGDIPNPTTAAEAIEAPILAGVRGGGGGRSRSPEESFPAAGNAERRPALSDGRTARTGCATGARDRVRTGRGGAGSDGFGGANLVRGERAVSFLRGDLLSA
jgi:hypothetical protein